MLRSIYAWKLYSGFIFVICSIWSKNKSFIVENFNGSVHGRYTLPSYIGEFWWENFCILFFFITSQIITLTNRVNWRFYHLIYMYIYVYIILHLLHFLPFFFCNTAFDTKTSVFPFCPYRYDSFIYQNPRKSNKIFIMKLLKQYLWFGK